MSLAVQFYSFSSPASLFPYSEGANPRPTKQPYQTGPGTPRPVLYGLCRALCLPPGFTRKPTVDEIMGLLVTVSCVSPDQYVYVDDSIAFATLMKVVLQANSTQASDLPSKPV